MIYCYSSYISFYPAISPTAFCCEKFYNSDFDEVTEILPGDIIVIRHSYGHLNEEKMVVVDRVSGNMIYPVIPPRFILP